MKDDFWSKVGECKHEPSKDHFVLVGCVTEFCSGSETRCAKCKVYITECSCGYMNEMSGWTRKRNKLRNNP